MWVAGQRIEIVVKVERCSLLVDGINHDDPATGPSSCLEDDEQCLDQKLRAESRSLHRRVDGEFGQQNRRDPSRCTTAKPARYLITIHVMRRHPEVSNDSFHVSRSTIDKNEHPSAMTRSVTSGAAQPTIEFVVPAIEEFDIMRVERFEIERHLAVIRPERRTRRAARAKAGAGDGRSRAASNESK